MCSPDTEKLRHRAWLGILTRDARPGVDSFSSLNNRETAISNLYLVPICRTSQPGYRSNTSQYASAWYVFQPAAHDARIAEGDPLGPSFVISADVPSSTGALTSGVTSLGGESILQEMYRPATAYYGH